MSPPYELLMQPSQELIDYAYDVIASLTSPGKGGGIALADLEPELVADAMLAGADFNEMIPPHDRARCWQYSCEAAEGALANPAQVRPGRF